MRPSMRAMAGSTQTRVALLLALATTLLVSVSGQPLPAPAPKTPAPAAPAPASLLSPLLSPGPAPAPVPVFPPCQGVDVVYTTTSTVKIYPLLNNTPALQPYKFQATATLTNMGYSTVEGWMMGIDYQHGEILVSAGDVVLADGTPMPVDVANGTILTASPPENLKNAIETAGDLTQIQRQILITGTEFGVKLDPMPSNINITNPGYNCSQPTMFGNNTMHTCCVEPDKNISLTGSLIFLPSETGNITITYDVTQAYPSNYLAQVTISNDSPIARIDNWNLSWTWQEGEFIYTMQGAQTKVADTQLCLEGKAGLTYTGGVDLNKAVSCSLSPEILDLPVDRTNDTSIGGIQYCCKNGTILPAVIDPSKSKSRFQMMVYKVPPADTQVSHLVPPASFRIGDGTYKCGPPRLIAPTIFPDPYLQHSTAAVRTWQVTCNVTEQVRKPKCCVSFSTYYNDSISPCRTCACGCPQNPQPVCNANASAMLLPYGALTLAPENRTDQITAWARLNHKPIPNPLPCQDYCGVSINWHIVSDFSKGWSARMTLLDWSNITYPDWYAVVEMDKAYPGLQQAYSFNATKLPMMNNTFVNNSFVVQGLPGLNYLMAAQNFTSGKLQSVLSFTKQTTPGIQIPLGDGFPTKIWFNGDECSLPEFLPTSGAVRMAPRVWGAVVAVFCLFIMGPVGLL